jgi:hypothetical protein
VNHGSSEGARIRWALPHVAGIVGDKESYAVKRERDRLGPRHPRRRGRAREEVVPPSLQPGVSPWRAFAAADRLGHDLLMRLAILILVIAGCAIEDPDEIGALAAAPTHDLDICPGGGGGDGDSGGDADPRPIPAPRDCTAEPTHEQCYACCDWNVENVWGERCRRIKDRGERKRCWADASERRGACQRECPRLTITREPWAP